MKTTPEELARKCAEQSGELRFTSRSQTSAKEVYVEETTKIIFSAIPLQELLEVARAAQSYYDSPIPRIKRELRDALATLKNKGVELE